MASTLARELGLVAAAEGEASGDVLEDRHGERVGSFWKTMLATMHLDGAGHLAVVVQR